jgi:hypothetical protein
MIPERDIPPRHIAAENCGVAFSWAQTYQGFEFAAPVNREVSTAKTMHGIGGGPAEATTRTNDLAARFATFNRKEPVVNRGIYIVALVVIVIAILSFFGLL